MALWKPIPQRGWQQEYTVRGPGSILLHVRHASWNHRRLKPSILDSTCARKISLKLDLRSLAQQGILAPHPHSGALKSAFSATPFHEPATHQPVCRSLTARAVPVSQVRRGTLRPPSTLSPSWSSPGGPTGYGSRRPIPNRLLEHAPRSFYPLLESSGACTRTRSGRQGGAPERARGGHGPPENVPRPREAAGAPAPAEVPKGTSGQRH